MIYIDIVLCFLYVAFQMFQKQKIYKPAVLFAFIWGTALVMYSFHAYNLPDVNNGTYLIIFAGLLSFFLGSAGAEHSKKRIVVGNYHLFTKEIKTTTYNIMTMIFFALMFLPVLRATLLLARGASLYSIRYSLQNDILGTGITAILFNYFCEPYLVFMIVYSVANLFSSNRKAKNMVHTIVGIFIMTIISGGRFFIFYFIGSLIVCFLLCRNTLFASEYVNKKLFRRAKFLIILSAVLIISVSFIRESVLTETMYVYFCGGVPFLEHLNETIVNNSHTYGAATLYGFTRPFFVVLRKIGITDLPLWLKNVEQIFLKVDDPYYLAPGILFNSFSTGFFAPYLDGGLAGVIIVYLLFGFITEKIYIYVDINNEYSVSWFLLASLTIVLSFFRLTITHYSFALAFVYLFYMSKVVPSAKSEATIGC